MTEPYGTEPYGTEPYGTDPYGPEPYGLEPHGFEPYGTERYGRAELGLLRREVADACRVLAARGLADGFLGHISLRVDEHRLLIRCRGPKERGLAWTTDQDIHLITLNGTPAAPGELATAQGPLGELYDDLGPLGEVGAGPGALEEPGNAGEAGAVGELGTPGEPRTPGERGTPGERIMRGEVGGWRPPNELPLHAEILRTRPDVGAVVHAHPPAVVAADLAGVRIRPIVGAFDIPGAKLAAGGVPVYPRGVLIRDRRLAGEMVAAMGDRPVVVLRGHGLTSCGADVPEAVLHALSVDRIARLSLAVLSAGGELRDLPPEDLAELPDLGAAFNRDVAWRHELARLQLPSETK